ncbi:MAG: beta-ketoacyl synthase [Muribaculaceae bacterium]|nr:beta-ketoacyl synthase [Muribaculaceae bacterium]MDD6701303.1 beta-ketoacyl synthase N-terminal-like domain-containing protein [Bacteroidales bacterium]
MIKVVAHNIISPLGFSSIDNFRRMAAGDSMLSLHHNLFGLSEPFCASLLDRLEISSRFDALFSHDLDLTFFEKLAILSAHYAIVDADLDPAKDDVIFILSTTKGNVDLLADNPDDPRCFLAESARRIARSFGNMNTPIVISNACISGVCAQIAAVRELMFGGFRHAIVIGCDILSRFIISGFQSFKALSLEPCRPFDADRSGLNLGEAAGSIVFNAVDDTNAENVWHFIAAANHNDANHISGPSRTGEGSFRVLSDILSMVDPNDIAFVNVHGTATLYNDEMESIALHRAGLDDIPVNGFKGYYGHTLGAAGVIETILSMLAVDNNMVPATRGFNSFGTSFHPSLSNIARQSDRQTFIKILSGFGGSNAGIALSKCAL